ncbi:MAG: BsuBI/PstI family type II restriction endonuclease [Gemmatimonadota bacterium]|nr:BsuBI/PstI family type II restriction endonuclease [Gemmatimonadota bacterium]MDE2870423.1 BsuBI/PstI family type II restriction endonuclease [Gemmatimonadota bacterium]
MRDVALAETVDFLRIDASLKLDAKRRAALGQYMTPVPTSRFMASLFSETQGDMLVLDPGAGVGSLTAALAERLCAETAGPRSVDFVCYEIDAELSDYLADTLRNVEARCRQERVSATSRLLKEDFILGHGVARQPGLFDGPDNDSAGFTHTILNPPYRKIKSDSAHRKALRSAGLETSNLYTGFMYVAARRLREGGEMVAIVPRSFCNGPYFRPFRRQFFSMMRLRHIHVFEKRDHAFKDDDVLQENIIVHAVKGGPASDVTITTSCGGVLELDAARGMHTAADLTQRTVPLGSVIREGDPDRFVHIAADGIEQGIMDRMAHFVATLADIGVEVSTGPVVDFRLKDDLRAEPEDGAVPLLYPAHFRDGSVSWPKVMRKPNAIQVSDGSRKWLWANEGSYVVVRRFTSKEERRRLVAAVYGSDLPGALIGFENHLNVFHIGREGMPPNLAAGLALFLNCTLVDRYFRQFNGHTQVNATDLRRLRYPDRATLERLGGQHGALTLSQQTTDTIIEGEIAHMARDENPLEARRKIDEAIAILKALGMPRGQQNDRSALTLLALLDLRPSGAWNQLGRPLMGITPIMDYTREHYGREYAPNTRETFRRQTMHQFVEAGIALYNPDDPARPVNSPNACYQISEEALRAIMAFDTPAWDAAVERWLAIRTPLAAKWAQDRAMQMIPVKVAKRREVALTPGPHSELIREILNSFAPRFAPGAEVIYVGDTGDKVGHFDEEALADLGVTVDRHGKMPDVVLYLGEKNWLLLVEAVTSHGPMDAKRHNELADLFAGARPGLIYVTAFPDRKVMGRYLTEISWETEVWCADAPSHLIHFDGERFLGPYEPVDG